jgi:hypothetical protein
MVWRNAIYILYISFQKISITGKHLFFVVWQFDASRFHTLDLLDFAGRPDRVVEFPPVSTLPFQNCPENVGAPVVVGLHVLLDLALDNRHRLPFDQKRFSNLDSLVRQQTLSGSNGLDAKVERACGGWSGTVRFLRVGVSLAAGEVGSSGASRTLVFLAR